MVRRFRYDFKADQGSSLVEYGLALVLIGLVAVLVVSFVGRSASDAFDEVGAAIPADPVAASPNYTADPDVFNELLERIESIDSLGDSLAGKAEEAERRYLEGDVGGALSRLGSLIKEVDAQQGKQLSHDEAAWSVTPHRD
jgi:Flp pilus assembly pilin Flp